MLEPLTLKNFISHDERGYFSKIMSNELFDLLNFDVRETFFSRSKYGVFRGFHFQSPPHSQRKLVTCVEGEIFDVLIDIRSKKRTFKNCYVFNLNSVECQTLYVPNGFAHGFLTLSTYSTVFYHCDNYYNQASDTGIHWKSADVDWPTPIKKTSRRDHNFKILNNFSSPF